MSDPLIDALMAELRWIDPQNPTLDLVRRVRAGQVVRWPSFLAQRRVAQTRHGDRFIPWRLAPVQPDSIWSRVKPIPGGVALDELRRSGDRLPQAGGGSTASGDGDRA